MKFQKPITEVIKMRTSCRTYDFHDIENEVVQKLYNYTEEINSEAKGKARFKIINKNNKKDSTVKLGTYGVISGADSFIVGIINKDNNDKLSWAIEI